MWRRMKQASIRESSMLLLYCLAVLTLLLLYYFYVPTNSLSSAYLNKYNGLFRANSKYNQIKFVSIRSKTNSAEACKSSINLKSNALKVISRLHDLIWPFMKYLGVSVNEEAVQFRNLNNGNELKFVCTQFSQRILETYK